MQLVVGVSCIHTEVVKRVEVEIYIHRMVVVVCKYREMEVVEVTCRCIVVGVFCNKEVSGTLAEVVAAIFGKTFCNHLLLHQ